MKLLSLGVGLGVAFLCNILYNAAHDRLVSLFEDLNKNKISVYDSFQSQLTSLKNEQSLKSHVEGGITLRHLRGAKDLALSRVSTQDRAFDRNFDSRDTLLGGGGSSTDDYTTHHSSISIYNALYSIKVFIGTISIIIIVFSVFLVESWFDFLNDLTRDTPFQELSAAIERELMVVGTMAFIFKIILNLGLIHSHDWIIALEYADLVIPVTSFIFCFEGIFLIFMSIKQCELWSRSYRLIIVELLDRYLNARSVWLTERFTWIPWSVENSEMEFRIFHILFCEQYNIQRSALAFDEYVERIFEKFLLSVITIQPIDWFVVLIFVVGNLIRNVLGINIGCSSHSHSCSAESSIKIFTLLGTLIFVAAIVLAVLSRLYEIRLLRRGNIASGKDYVPFLQADDVNLNSAIERAKFASTDLKLAISDAKAHEITKDKFSVMHYVEYAFRIVKDKLGITNKKSRIYVSLRESLANESVANERMSSFSSHSQSHSLSQSTKGRFFDGKTKDKLNKELLIGNASMKIRLEKRVKKKASSDHSSDEEDDDDSIESNEEDVQVAVCQTAPDLNQAQTNDKSSKIPSDKVKMKRTSSHYSDDSSQPGRLGGYNGSDHQFFVYGTRLNSAKVRPDRSYKAEIQSILHESIPLELDIGSRRQSPRLYVESSKEEKTTPVKMRIEKSKKISRYPSTENQSNDHQPTNDNDDQSANGKLSKPPSFQIDVSLKNSPSKLRLMTKRASRHSNQDVDLSESEDDASIPGHSNRTHRREKVLPEPFDQYSIPIITGPPVDHPQIVNQKQSTEIENTTDVASISPKPPMTIQKSLRDMLFGGNTSEKKDTNPAAVKSPGASKALFAIFSPKTSSGNKQNIDVQETVPEDPNEAAPDNVSSVNNPIARKDIGPRKRFPPPARSVSSLNKSQVARGLSTNANLKIIQAKLNNHNPDNPFGEIPSKIKSVLMDRMLVAEDRAKTRRATENFLRGYSTDLGRVFAFDSPYLYFHSVNVLMMVISFYMAVWATNFLSSAINDLHSPAWVVLSLAPGVLSFAVFIYIVKCAALLKAVLFIDHDVMEETIEQTETSNQLSESLRNKVVAVLQGMGDPERELFNLYHIMDSSQTNALTRKEFQLFLEAMGITFSRKRWGTIFRTIDRDYDDKISFEELVLFVFPTHKSATVEENKRLKAAQNRVTLKTQQNARRKSSFARPRSRSVVGSAIANAAGSLMHTGSITLNPPVPNPSSKV